MIVTFKNCTDVIVNLTVRLVKTKKTVKAFHVAQVYSGVQARCVTSTYRGFVTAQSTVSIMQTKNNFAAQKIHHCHLLETIT